MSLLTSIPHPWWLVACAVVALLLPARNMFDPAVCFKSALLVFGVAFVAFRYAYGHTGHYSLTGALVMAAAPVVFGIIGLRGG